MKKILLVAGLAVFGTASAQSDKASFGVNAGMLTGFATVKTPFGNSSSSDTGFYAGFFAEFAAGKNFKIQPALNYANIDNASALQIPIMAKYYAASNFNLQFAPQFLIDLEENPVPDAYTPFNFGLGLGAGYDFTTNLSAEVRYAFQLNDHFKNMPSGYSAKANYLNLGLGYKF